MWPIKGKEEILTPLFLSRFASSSNDSFCTNQKPSPPICAASQVINAEAGWVVGLACPLCLEHMRSRVSPCCGRNRKLYPEYCSVEKSWSPSWCLDKPLFLCILHVPCSMPEGVPNFFWLWQGASCVGKKQGEVVVLHRAWFLHRCHISVPADSYSTDNRSMSECSFCFGGAEPQCSWSGCHHSWSIISLCFIPLKSLFWEKGWWKLDLEALVVSFGQQRL